MLRRYHVVSVGILLLGLALGLVVTVRAQQPIPHTSGGMIDNLRMGLFGPPRTPNQGQANPMPGQNYPPTYNQMMNRHGQHRRPYPQQAQRPRPGNPANMQPHPEAQQAGPPGLGERVQRFIGEPVHRQPYGRKSNKVYPQTRQPAAYQPPTYHHTQTAPSNVAPAPSNVPTRSRRATGDRPAASPNNQPEIAEETRDESQDEAPAQALPSRRESSTRPAQTEERAIVSDSGATSSRRTLPTPAEESSPTSRSTDEPAASSHRPAAPVETTPASEPSAGPNSVVDPQFNAPRETRAPVARDALGPRVGQAPVESQPEQSPSGDNVLLRRQGPALVVETQGPRRIIVGKEAVYRIVLRNLGENASGGASVAVHTPAWADLRSATASKGKVQHPTAGKPEEGIKWHLPGLRAGGNEELVLKLIPRDSRPLDIAVSLQSATVDSQFSVEVHEPKLLLSIEGPKEVHFGEKAVFELTFANPGTSDAENVLVRLQPLDPGDEADTHEIGTIPAGARQTVEIELVARQPGTLAIVAEATADAGLRSDARRDVVVLKPELKIEVLGPKFRYAGTIATYTIRVHNPGNALARNLQLGAMLPVQSTFVSASEGGAPKEGEPNQVAWKLADIQAGGEQTFELKCELEKAGPNRIQVAALGDGDLRDTTFISTVVEALADLDLEVRDPKGPMPVGEEVAYEIVVKNRGTQAAENVNVFAFFSEGVEPVQVQGQRHHLEPGKVILDPILKLGPGEQVVVKIIARAQKAGNHMFRAEVHCPSLSIKLSEQETTRFYGEDRQRTSSEESSDDNEASDDAPAGPARKEPPKITPSHPKPVAPGGTAPAPPR